MFRLIAYRGFESPSLRHLHSKGLRSVTKGVGVVLSAVGHWKLILPCIAALISGAVHAETDLVLMGKSWHFGHQVPAGEAGYNVNQYNWGGGLEYRFDGTGWFAGGLTYHDTFRQQAYAVYGGYQATLKLTDNLSAFAAVRAGYLNGSGWHGPGVLPSLGLTYKRVSVEAVYIPPARNGYNCLAVFGRIAF